jgi:hypothetical protein
MSERLQKILALVICFVAAIASVNANAEEIWLADNTRIFGLVKAASSTELIVALYTGEDKKIPLEDIITIRYLGRTPLLVQTGVQEFRLTRGGTLRGEILQSNGDQLRILTALAGIVDLDVGHMKGFVALPLSGFVGRKAEETIENEAGRYGTARDIFLDRHGDASSCALSSFSRTQVLVDDENTQTIVTRPIIYMKGLRLADGARFEHAPWSGEIQLRISSRDGSVIEGTLDRIYLGKWYLRPAWDPKAALTVDVEEITLVQIQGGKVQYLSQLSPIKNSVKESSILVPPQPFKMDRGCQGEDISIAGKRYPWGIGVHANSELSFDLNGRFKEFLADAGVASRMGNQGSVVFTVLGDGKELFKSPVVHGGDEKALSIKIPVAGVKVLTLRATNADDLDLSDAANWGSARVVR